MIKSEKEIPFIITISYLLSFLLIRVSVYIAGSAQSEFAQVAKMGGRSGTDFYIGRNIILYGFHIHHFYIGIFLICIAAWIAIVNSDYVSRKNMAIIYGIGLGLFFDEIGLLLTWGDYYSSLTYTIIIFVFGVFINLVFFYRFWESFKVNLLSSRSHNTIEKFLLSNKNIMNTIDFISKKTGKTKRLSLFFSGMLYIFISGMILWHAKFIRYWIGGTFIMSGLSFITRASIKSEETES